MAALKHNLKLFAIVKFSRDAQNRTGTTAPPARRTTTILHPECDMILPYAWTKILGLV